MQPSFKYPGHEQRLEGHRQRIYGQMCACGSGLSYGKCCLKRHDQSEREIRYRRSRGELICLDKDLA